VRPYLGISKAAALVGDLNSGYTVRALVDKYAISYSGVWAWRRYLGLDAYWFKRVRDLERSERLLAKRHAEADRLLKIASTVIKQFEPNYRLRALMATGLRAHFKLRRIDANRVLGITYSAGSATNVRKNDAALVALMREYLSANPGRGFKKMFEVLLRGRPNSRPQAYKLYLEHRMQLKNRKKATPPPRVRRPMAIQNRQDEVWSMDYMMGVLPDGSRFYVLNAIDDFNRECLFNAVTLRNTTKAVIEALTAVGSKHRKPRAIRTDNGGEFKSKQFGAWTTRRGISHRYGRPGRSTDNAYIESFNNTVRREVLNAYEFRSVAEVQRMLDDWRVRYNLAYPHKALGGLSPVQFAHIHAEP